MMQIDLPTKENISAYVVEAPSWISDVLVIMIGLCLVLVVVMGVCRAFLKMRMRQGKIEFDGNQLDDDMTIAQMLAGAGASVILIMLTILPIVGFLPARFDMLHETCDKIEQAYNITLSENNRHIINEVILSDGNKVRDANGDYKNPLVEPIKLEEIWTDEDGVMSSQQYYCMIIDRTDSTASFELVEPTSDGKEWQKVPLVDASEASSNSQSK